VPFFYLFLFGALVAWRTLERISDRDLLLCLTLMALGAAWRPDIARLAGVFTAFFMYVGARMHRLNSWLSGRRLQWLGRVSYSLYLVHVPVAVLVLGLRARFAVSSNAVSLFAFVGVYALALGVAHVFNLTVETPFLRLSQRLKRAPNIEGALLQTERPG
jgi:peptidoglycan/LPS O-acetylase OafA/YrhL